MVAVLFIKKTQFVNLWHSVVRGNLNLQLETKPVPSSWKTLIFLIIQFNLLRKETRTEETCLQTFPLILWHTKISLLFKSNFLPTFYLIFQQIKSSIKSNKSKFPSTDSNLHIFSKYYLCSFSPPLFTSWSFQAFIHHSYNVTNPSLAHSCRLILFAQIFRSQ